MVAGFHIRDVAGEAERQAVRALLTAGFEVRPGVGAAFARLYDRLLEADAPAGTPWSRVALVAGRVAGHALLAPRSFYMDGAQVPGGIVAMVVVAPDHRGRGIGSALVRDVEAQARAQGMRMLHLAGDLRFYWRLGYVDGYLKCRADADVAVRRGRPPDLRRAMAADVDRMTRLSAGETPVGAVAPAPARWRWTLKTGHPAGLLAVNDVLLGSCAQEDFCLLLAQAGQVAGLARVALSGERAALYEAAAQDLEAAFRLFAGVQGFLAQRGCRRLSLHLPETNRLMRTAISQGAAFRCEPDPTRLVKLLDAPALLAYLRPVLMRRFQASDVRHWRGCVAVRTETGGFVLACREGALDLTIADGTAMAKTEWQIFLPEIGLARALLGTDRLSERIGQRADKRVLALLDALFPPGCPFFWLADAL